MEPPLLRLEASVDGQSTLYPTQRTRLVYQYFYNQNIALTKEVLPLLDATGLVKIGEKQVRDVQDKSISASEIAQEVEASLPGTYTYGPSVIEGYAYRSDAAGNILSKSEPLKSEAPPVVINVLGFPPEGRPQAFNGAVGSFTFSADLKGSNAVDVGNDLSVVLKIQGKGTLESVPLPDVCCQLGFVGLFRVSDLPPPITIKGDVKTAVVQIKPLTASVTEIPAITFSYFDPATKKYVSLNSNPIPIVVKGILPKRPAPVVAAKPVEIQKILPEPSMPSLNLAEFPTLTQDDLHNKPFGSWWTLLIVPLGIAFVAYQRFLHKFLVHRKKMLAASSNALLHTAKKEGVSSPRYFEHLTGALRLRLFEAGLISSKDLPLKKWPQDETCRQVAQWLESLEETRFSGKSSVDMKSVEETIDEFFSKIHVVPTTSTNDLVAAWVPATLFAAVILGTWLFAFPHGEMKADPRLAQAQESFKVGLLDKNLYGKEESILQAATLFHEMESEYRPRHGSGILDLALGNVYAHLGDIPRALLHNRRAAELRPADGSIKENIVQLQKLLYLDEKPRAAFPLSIATWIQIFFAVALAAIVGASLAVWTENRWGTRIIRVAIVCTLVASVPLIYYRYFSPIYGTVMTSTNLRAGPGDIYPGIGDMPVASGASVEVVGLAAKGAWLQVLTPDGTNGYVPSEALRF
jgi:hypothetical protein